MYGRFYRDTRAAVDRLGLSRFVLLRFAGGQHPAVQFGGGDGGIGQSGAKPALCILAATLGNTIGGLTCYYMGHLGRIDRIEKYFKVKKEKIDKMRHFLQGKGALMAFFTFLPFVGEAIAIALGFMRSNLALTAASMFAGKLVRYIVMLWALQGAVSMIG